VNKILIPWPIKANTYVNYCTPLKQNIYQYQGIEMFNKLIDRCW